MGEVMLRSNTVMAGYFQDEAATAAAFRGGWLHTGDLGVVHPDGYVELRDRAGLTASNRNQRPDRVSGGTVLMVGYGLCESALESGKGSGCRHVARRRSCDSARSGITPAGLQPKSRSSRFVEVRARRETKPVMRESVLPVF